MCHIAVPDDTYVPSNHTRLRSIRVSFDVAPFFCPVAKLLWLCSLTRIIERSS